MRFAVSFKSALLFLLICFITFAKIIYIYMRVYKTYIQQLSFDGIAYKKGEVADLQKRFRIVCSSFPFKRNPEAKDLPSRDWAGEDGRDIYIPEKIPMKNYEIEAVFVYKGTEGTISSDISDFVDFLYGRNENAVGGRLAVYDEYVGMGRKDVHVLSVDNDVYECSDADPDAIAEFKVKFAVEDPVTEIIPEYVSLSGVNAVRDLRFNI